MLAMDVHPAVGMSNHVYYLIIVHFQNCATFFYLTLLSAVLS